MKEFKISSLCGAAIVGVALLSGCASPYPMGALYTELKLPTAATSNASTAKEKVGTSMCTSVLGLVATGDASLETAMKNGGITKIHHVDWDAKNILGVYGEYRCTVYGE